MKKIILIPNKINSIRYEKVKLHMIKLGAPIIECIKVSENCFYAFEGSHRITCAKELNLMPILNIITDLENADDDNTLFAIKQNVHIRFKKGLVITF
jgi:hypothetical protein